MGFNIVKNKKKIKEIIKIIFGMKYIHMDILKEAYIAEVLNGL